MKEHEESLTSYYSGSIRGGGLPGGYLVSRSQTESAGAQDLLSPTPSAAGQAWPSSQPNAQSLPESSNQSGVPSPTATSSAAEALSANDYAPAAFFPAFGHKPSQLVGREQEISDFLRGLSSKPGDWHRITLISGFKGMGKTALALELADWAAAQGYVALWIPPDEDWSAALAQRVAQGGKLLVLCDGVQNPTSALRSLVAVYRSLSARGASIALAMSGEPKALDGVLSDSVLSFLQRSHRARLKALPLGRVEAALAHGLAKSGRILENDELSSAAQATLGHPYLLQLMGAHLQDAANSVQQACAYAQRDFADDVLAPMLSGLSARDIDVLKAMAALGGSASIAQLRAALNVTDGYLQPYRARLLKAGVITSPRRGQLAFALPCLELALENA